MEVEVVEFDIKFNCHKCKRPMDYGGGFTFEYIDLFVGAELPEGETNESVIGRFFEIKEVGTFLGYAIGIKETNPHPKSEGEVESEGV